MLNETLTHSSSGAALDMALVVAACVLCTLIFTAVMVRYLGR